jgi:hypothetical protein
MCTVLLPPGVNPIAVKYIYHIMSTQYLKKNYPPAPINVTTQTQKLTDPTALSIYVRQIRIGRINFGLRETANARRQLTLWNAVTIQINTLEAVG